MYNYFIRLKTLFIKIINESKIILGSANLEFRFGHTSILQYLSAAFNNLIFSELGILLPLANIFSIAVFYLLELRVYLIILQ